MSLLKKYGNIYRRHEQEIIWNRIDYIIEAHIDYKDNDNGYFDF